MTNEDVMRTIRYLDPDPELASHGEVERLRELAGYTQMAHDIECAQSCEDCHAFNLRLMEVEAERDRLARRYNNLRLTSMWIGTVLAIAGWWGWLR